MFKHLSIQQRWRAKKQAEGCCGTCGKKRDGESLSSCNNCLEKVRTRNGKSKWNDWKPGGRGRPPYKRK